jgi:acetyl-CoA carboxylase carboxyl transferase alpha subunit
MVLQHHFEFLGGSLGCAEGERLVRGLEMAMERDLPVIIECTSGGARMQEGTLSLMQMAKVSVAIAAVKAKGIPILTVCKDPTYGGVSASYAMQGDVRIATEGARIGFAGPNVILNTVYEMNQEKYDLECPPHFQSAEFLQDNGQLDVIVPPEQLQGTIAEILKILWGAKQAKEHHRPHHGGEAGEAEEAPWSVNKQTDNGKRQCSQDYTQSRRMDRYQPQDIINLVFSDFVTLHGDGCVSVDASIKGGIATFQGRSVVVLGTFKGHSPGDMQKCNFGMADPSGYRIALKLMKLAEHFNMPVVTMIDTVGAYPSFGSEQRGQSEAIATNLLAMSSLRTPIISLLIGEGGSGGALGIGMGDRIAMLSRGYFSVISPEGAASILGRYDNEQAKAKQFPIDCRNIARVQNVYADQLLKLGVIDEILWEKEDLSAEIENYTNCPQIVNSIRDFVARSISRLYSTDTNVLVANRYAKFRQMGKFGKLSGDDKRRLLSNSTPSGSSRSKKKEKPASKPSKTLDFLADVILNPPFQPEGGVRPAPMGELPLSGPAVTPTEDKCAKLILDAQGPEGVVAWIKKQNRVLLTDTTMRDAHQSLLATRVRTVDLMNCAGETGRVMNDMFSLECWGGATFDVAYRFLHEDPWERLRLLRKKLPHIMLQMLIRGANAVGYTSYPDNVIREFVRLAAKNGIDVFRIFDCFNDLEQMKLTIECVRAEKKIAEVAISFTGNFMSPKETIYTLKYYQDLATAITAAGAHIIAIKDMAGLMRPQMAKPFMAAIRAVTDLPIHFHTHATSGASLATTLAMADNGCDIIDFALASMSDTTSQPSLNAFLAAMEGHERDPGVDFRTLEPLDNYWAAIRRIYAPFESGMKTGTASVFEHQIPGGQYSNLMAQAKDIGNLDQWERIVNMYRDVNALFGDIVKVTPSSKSVGDMALFLIGKGMTIDDVKKLGTTVQYPGSVISLMKGEMGFPHHGFPTEIQDIILNGQAAMKDRPGNLLAPIDFELVRRVLEDKFVAKMTDEDVMGSVLYPKVFEDYRTFLGLYGPTIPNIPSSVIMYGMAINDEILVPVDDHGDRVEEHHVTVAIRLKRISPLGQNAMRTLTFNVNGNMRTTTVKDKSLDAGTGFKGVMADRSDIRQLASPMPGNVEKIFANPGDVVKAKDKLMLITAMKMEVIVSAPYDGKIVEICIEQTDRVNEGTLLIRMEPGVGSLMKNVPSLAEIAPKADQ